MADPLSEQIQKIATEAIKAQAQAAIIEQLGGADRLVESLMTAMMNEKVRVNYSDVRLIHHVVQECVKDSIREFVRDFMAQHRAELQAELAKRFRTDGKALAAALVDTVVRQADSLYLNVQTRAEMAG